MQQNIHYLLNSRILLYLYLVTSFSDLNMKNKILHMASWMYPLHTTVWFAFWAGGEIGPFISEDDKGATVIVNWNPYRIMTSKWLVPKYFWVKEEIQSVINILWAGCGKLQRLAYIIRSCSAMGGHMLYVIFCT